MVKKTGLDIVDDLLGNEKSAVRKNIDRQRKQKKFVKSVPSKPMTEADLILSGWNLDYDPGNKTSHKIGDVIELSQEREEWTKMPRRIGLRVTGVPSRHRMASVYCPYYSIYGWGIYIENAIKDCLVNCKNWRDSASETDIARVNKIWARKCLASKKTEDKDVAGILAEVGL